jgi:MFS family permease
VLIAFLLTQCLVGVLFLQSHGSLPVALGARGISSSSYGAIIALNGLIIVVLQPITLGWVSRQRRTRALALGALLTGVGFGLNALPLGIAGATASVAVWTLGEIVVSPVVPAVLSDLAPTRLRARYQGMGQAMYGLCSIVGPPLGLWTLERGSPVWLWGGCFGSGVLAAILHLGSARWLQARLGGRGQPA